MKKLSISVIVAVLVSGVSAASAASFGEYYLQQWFYGWSEEDGAITARDQSAWKAAKNGKCPADGPWILVKEASSNWGSYLVTGADYCVRADDLE